MSTATHPELFRHKFHHPFHLYANFPPKTKPPEKGRRFFLGWEADVKGPGLEAGAKPLIDLQPLDQDRFIDAFQAMGNDPQVLLDIYREAEKAAAKEKAVAKTMARKLRTSV